MGTNGTISRPHTYYATRCHFEKNGAVVGGGLFFFIDLSEGRSNIAYISLCTFVNNVAIDKQQGYGAAIAVVNSESYTNEDLFPVNHLTDW